MNQQQFLQECGKSYPVAVAALGFFRQLVLQRFKPVVEAHIQELGAIIEVPHQELRLLEHANPEKLASAIPDQFELGWKAKRSENLYLYFYLYWLTDPDEGNAPIGIAIEIRIKDRAKRERLAEALDQLVEDPAFAVEPWFYGFSPYSIEIWMDLKEDELSKVGDKLDELFGYTIKFLKGLRGIANYFRV